MSILNGEFVCPVCGWIKRIPYTEQDIITHLKTHPEDPTLTDRVLRAAPKKRGRPV
jgi:RNase P subunit RPR2